MRFLGPLFTIVMGIASVVFGVILLCSGNPYGVAAMGIIFATSAYEMVARDWPLTWKPLIAALEAAWRKH